MSSVHTAGEFYSVFPERRINPFKPEVRMAGDGGPGHIVGYGAVFNKLSRKLGGFVEKVAPRAFNRSGAEGWPDVVCRYNHNDDFLLGTTRAGTCQIMVDSDGLQYDVVPPQAQAGILELCQRGDVAHSSFAFRVPEEGDEWGLTDYSYPLRTLVSVELVDVAPVVTPAYPDATAAARAMDGAVESLAHRFSADPTEIRSLLSENQGVKLFKRSDRPSVPAQPAPEEEIEVAKEDRAKLTSKERSDLPISAFAYVDPDGVGHYPIHDAAHVRAALARIAQGDQYGQQALPKVKAAAKKMGIDTAEQNAWADVIATLENRDLPAWFITTEAEVDETEERTEDVVTDVVTDEVNESEEAEEEVSEDDESDEDRAKKKKPAPKPDSSDDNDADDSKGDGKKTGKGLPPWLQQKRMMNVLQGKRYDPYLDSDEE
jgi:hypothetical protein